MKRILILIALVFMGQAVFAQEAEDLDLTYATDMLALGAEAPEFTLDDIAGKPVSISDFRGRKVVLVFWASWCPDCRAEVPELKAMMAAAAPSEVAFVSVSFDRTREAFETYVRENYLGGVQLFEPAGKKESAVGAAYHVKWIPSLYVLDADGNVLLGTVMIGKVAQALGADVRIRKPGQGLCTDESCAL